MDGWSQWEKLPGTGATFSPRTLHELLDGGQAFRWNKTGEGHWQGIVEKHLWRLQPDSEGAIYFQQWGKDISSASLQTIQDYLQLTAGAEEALDALPSRTDPHLAACMSIFPGLRILKQPLAETLLAFLLSSNKQIVQIKQMLETLAKRYGDEIAPEIHALPDWQTLATVSLTDLQACRLGYRAKYVWGTAQLVAKSGYFDFLSTLPYPEAREELMKLPGVGGKVADCVLLFGDQRLAAFPMDVWILRTMRTRYELEGWSDRQIRHFADKHFGPLAGLAQQYLFAWERYQARM